MTEPKRKPDRGERGEFLPGNLAGMKHGAYSLVSRDQLPLIKGRKAIARRVREFREGVEKALPKMSPQRQALLDKAAMIEGVLQIMFSDLRRHGIWRGDKLRRQLFVLQPAIGENIISLINTQRLLLKDIGLDAERADQVLDIGRYIAAKDAAQESGEGEKGPENAARRDIPGDRDETEVKH